MGKMLILKDCHFVVPWERRENHKDQDLPVMGEFSERIKGDLELPN